MKQSNTQKHNIDGKNVRVAIIISEFNKDIVDKLFKSTVEELRSAETQNINVFTVPGALEIPIVAKKIISKKHHDVIIALGAVIKGETTHFEHVSRESTHALTQLSIETEFPIINGILTVLNKEQALARIDRGKEFAQSALHLLNTLNTI